ncbi:RAxF-45 family protein [Bacillus sp. 2205SS5-2]
MKHVGLRTQFLAYIHICRAIFHVNIVEGMSLPFFNNFIVRPTC